MTPRPQTIDEYLLELPLAQRDALERLRRTIHAAAPRAEECISYQLPSFRLDNERLVAFGASKRHCALYPMSSTAVEAFREQLKDYDTSVGTIRFQARLPLPVYRPSGAPEES